MLECIGTRKNGGPSTGNNHGTRLTIPIPGDVDARLRRMAQRRGIRLATLIRPWIIANLEAEEQKELPIAPIA